MERNVLHYEQNMDDSFHRMGVRLAQKYIIGFYYFSFSATLKID